MDLITTQIRKKPLALIVDDDITSCISMAAA